MNLRELTSVVSENDELLELQLRVARRADELAIDRKTKTALNLHCWLIAETEVLGRSFLDQPTFIPRSGLSVEKLEAGTSQTVR